MVYPTYDQYFAKAQNIKHRSMKISPHIGTTSKSITKAYAAAYILSARSSVYMCLLQNNYIKKTVVCET